MIRTVAILVLLLAADALHAQAAPNAADEHCGRADSVRTADGAYIIQNGEWNSRAKACIRTDGSASFLVSTSEIDNTNGGPGSFVSILQGCHWGLCTPVNPFPIQVAVLKSEVANWSATHADGMWDQTFDLWFAKQRSVPGQPDGAELMVILRPMPRQSFPGNRVGTAKIHGKRYDIWFAAPPQAACNYIAYISAKPQKDVNNFDLRAFIRDAVLRGYIDNWWYQLSVEAGFEIWKGGAGLKTNAFSVAVK